MTTDERFVSERHQILVVEDDSRLCQALRLVIDGGRYRAEVVSSAAAALAAVERREPSLVLVDLGLPDLDGIELIERLVSRRPSIVILVLTAVTAPARIVAAIRAGARGYLFKEDLGRRLVDAIDDALAGGAPLSAAAARAIVTSVRDQDHCPADPSPLTARESDVLAALARGFTFDESGAALGISAHTVRSHARAVYDKLGASNKAEAVAIAMRQGWLSELADE